ncbi:MAG: ParA family protein [bacterium]
MLDNLIAIANGKGGAGKTTLAAQLGGIAANSGWRTLIVDLDAQGNLGRDLGYYDTDANDHGAALAAAVVTRTPPERLRDARPGLDVIPAGRETPTAEAALAARRSADPHAVGLLGEILAPVADDYDLVLCDCPPATHAPVVEAALVAARWLLIPTFRDEGSLDGLERMADKVTRIRDDGLNPALELLGIAMLNFRPHGIDTRDVRAELVAALGEDLVFRTVVRENANAAAHARKLGMLQYEYELAAADQEPWYKQRNTRRFSRSATGLSADYQALTDEILGRYITCTQQAATA